MRLNHPLLAFKMEEGATTEERGSLYKLEKALKWIPPLEPSGGTSCADTLIGPSETQFRVLREYVLCCFKPPSSLEQQQESSTVHWPKS